jgi:hypothetical protein
MMVERPCIADATTYSSESSDSHAPRPNTMDHLFAQATPLVMFLLPGFVSALIFYGLTSHPKPTQFERTVEALVFTFVIHVASKGVELVLMAAGRFHAVGAWDSDTQIFWSVGLAIALGAGLAALANKDTVHSWLRRKGFTSRTSHPSEWFSVLGSTSSYLVLNLHDGRRLTGWPKEWPVTPDKGQFYLQEPAWIDESNNAVELDTLDGILINATEVRWVEIHLNRERL